MRLALPGIYPGWLASVRSDLQSPLFATQADRVCRRTAAMSGRVR
jgi:hypothetical protein